MRLRITYTGRVQGVGFRATAASVVRDLPLTGWVRNEPDGSVTLEIQGSDDDLREARDRVARAMRANIRGEDVQRIPETPGEVDFAIRRG